MFTAIDHVGIAVADLDEALAYYAKNFDLRSVHEEVNEEHLPSYSGAMSG